MYTMSTTSGMLSDNVLLNQIFYREAAGLLIRIKNKKPFKNTGHEFMIISKHTDIYIYIYIYIQIFSIF